MKKDDTIMTKRKMNLVEFVNQFEECITFDEEIDDKKMTELRTKIHRIIEIGYETISENGRTDEFDQAFEIAQMLIDTISNSELDDFSETNDQFMNN